MLIQKKHFSSAGWLVGDGNEPIQGITDTEIFSQVTERGVATIYNDTVLMLYNCMKKYKFGTGSYLRHYM